jgi:phosphate starvation-inducible PhoH-like protein
MIHLLYKYILCVFLTQNHISMRLKANIPMIAPKSISMFSPKTSNQKLYVNVLKNMSYPLVFATGPAGTGKTLLSCIEAIKSLENGKIEKIIITRPLIAVQDEEIGFLPGSMMSKMDPWTRPIFDIFQKLFTINELNSMIQNHVIEFAPLAFMRGRTFDYAFIIADEMQNSSPQQMLMLTTRIGNNTKLVICGDTDQTDHIDQETNGLSDFLNRYKLHQIEENIKIIKFNNSDIRRSAMVASILNIYKTPSYIVNNNNTNYFKKSDASLDSWPVIKL